MCNISSGSCATRSDEAISLAPPFFNTLDPTLVSQPFTDCPQDQQIERRAANCDTSISPAFTLDGGAGSSSAPSSSTSHAPSRCKRNRTTSKSGGCPYRREKVLNSWNNTTDLMITGLSQNILCPNFYSLLESELPQWTREGLWHESTQNLEATRNTSPPPSSYFKLEKAYRVVCRLDSRISSDLVRNRMALIQLHLEFTELHQVHRQTPTSNRTTSTRGRGEASHAIDHILKSLHKDWDRLGQKQQAQLRLEFHNKKKYGKRWDQLADALGPGILLICSTKLANAVWVLSTRNIPPWSTNFVSSRSSLLILSELITEKVLLLQQRCYTV